MKNSITEKRCSKCGKTGEFYDKLNICKQCISEQGKRWREENPEKKKESGRRWYIENRDKVLANVKRWSQANPEKKSAIVKNWHEAHPDKIKTHKKRWHDANPEKIIVNNKRWSDAHPENGRMNSQTRRARVEGNGGKFTIQEWIDLCEKYENKCLRCGQSDLKLTVDHVIPIFHGGLNIIDNIQPLCKKCNSSKGTKHIDYRPK